jgi:hypothetical protein
MDRITKYREVIVSILSDYAQIPYAYGNIETKKIFDKDKDHYLLVNVGWENEQRVYGCIIHIDIIDGKIWIQKDGTENGIVDELEKAGILKENIVLGFREPELRKFTGYASA